MEGLDPGAPRCRTLHELRGPAPAISTGCAGSRLLFPANRPTVLGIPGFGEAAGEPELFILPALSWGPPGRKCGVRAAAAAPGAWGSAAPTRFCWSDLGTCCHGHGATSENPTRASFPQLYPNPFFPAFSGPSAIFQVSLAKSIGKLRQRKIKAIFWNPAKKEAMGMTFSSAGSLATLKDGLCEGVQIGKGGPNWG